MRAVIPCCVGAWLASTGCGPRETVATASGGPVDYEVRAARVGQSLHLAIRGTRVSRRQSSAFDDPGRWQVDVRDGSRRLKRVVNGSVRVAREPVDQSDWRVSVDFSVAFAMPTPATEVKVRLAPPGFPARTLKVSVPR
jgi:hypothetical protein